MIIEPTIEKVAQSGGGIEASHQHWHLHLPPRLKSDPILRRSTKCWCWLSTQEDRLAAMTVQLAGLPIRLRKLNKLGRQHGSDTSGSPTSERWPLRPGRGSPQARCRGASAGGPRTLTTSKARGIERARCPLWRGPCGGRALVLYTANYECGRDRLMADGHSCICPDLVNPTWVVAIGPRWINQISQLYQLDS